MFLTPSAQLLSLPFAYSNQGLTSENALDAQKMYIKWNASDPREDRFLSSAAFVKTIASQLATHPFNELITIAHTFIGYTVSAIIHANVREQRQANTKQSIIYDCFSICWNPSGTRSRKQSVPSSCARKSSSRVNQEIEK